ncbi:conserved hypothetical protein [Histoplasma capsulatum var. duboisii H88]|uniref:Uncharacterized protein n=1 Tax=Ajellomyces capsulatus (strain H88) TaxID=544711 RepID=F0U925_AJEC8|nr:conserved hypothetical protein [Histoplasma capsulatum var. duboisii H88]QSS51760.1 hypothetical protein I7I53_07176 [Histoplasma capsulatum var. duboisii H88]
MTTTPRHDHLPEPELEPLNVTNGDSVTTNTAKAISHDKRKSYRLRRFPLRAVAVIFGPIIVLAYFAFIWKLIQTREGHTLKFGFSNELWIYYSWFLVGVFGLNFSKYGLLGIEASMLHDRTWQVENTMTLLMHCDSSWNGPGGWFKCCSAFLQRRRIAAGRLWYTLAALSLVPFVALPLSGLTMEPVRGYVKLRDPPLAIGHKLDDFHRRSQEANENLFWRTGFPPKLPGLGIAYIAPHVQRESFPYLREVPNILPSNVSESNPEFFLAPQANVPINGTVWGLLIGCNCSIVKSFSEFKILSQRPPANFNESSSLVTLNLNSSMLSDRVLVAANQNANLVAHAQIGFNLSGVYGHASWAAPKPMPALFEYALWQAHRDMGFSLLGEQLNFSKTIDFPMAGVNGPYFQAENGTFYFNQTFYGNQPDENGTVSSDPVYQATALTHIAPPIGVRCIRDSKLGYADVDWQGSFRSFTESAPQWVDSHESGDQWAFGQIGDAIAGKFTEILTSTNSPTTLSLTHGLYFPSYIQAETLYRSIMLAHAWDALELMYDSGYSFESAYILPNTTSSRASTVMGPGVIPPIYVGVLFAIWTVGSVIFGCVYGFRCRWSDTLDGYSMFRFGADFAQEIKDEPDFACASEFQECQALWKLPGLVGDSELQMDIGHITLVKRGNEPSKGKKYR